MLAIRRKLTLIRIEPPETANSYFKASSHVRNHPKKTVMIYFDTAQGPILQMTQYYI